MNYDIVNETYKQFGGALAMRMIGGQSGAVNENTLQIKWKSKAKNKAKIVHIELTALDTYIVKFFTLSGNQISLHDNIYNDMLINLFESETGLYLRL